MKLEIMNSCHHIQCSSESERGDVMALFELLGCTNAHPESNYAFELAPWVWFIDNKRQYMTCTSGNTADSRYNTPASEFIRDNF